MKKLIIANMPTIEAEPIRHGHWIKDTGIWDLIHPAGQFTCSVCNRSTGYGAPPWCMYCGAKMDGCEE